MPLLFPIIELGPSWIQRSHLWMTLVVHPGQGSSETLASTQGPEGLVPGGPEVEARLRAFPP